MDYSGMSTEELVDLLNSQTTEIETLTAERDSLTEENNALKEAAKTAADEIQETKKLNFTLARQLDTRKQKATFEESMISLFGRGSK
jgi:FtsZ-binding cell division protein ZapB